MSRIGYIIAPSILDAARFADLQKWVRLGATRFTNEDKQDIRWAKTPGEIIAREFPTDVWRDKHWQKMVEDWATDKPFWIEEMNRLQYDGNIRFVNEVEGVDEAA